MNTYYRSKTTALRRPLEPEFAALVGVEPNAGHLAAAHRDGHGQRAVGERRVMPLAQGESQHPAGGHIQDRDQVQPALIGGDLGAVTEPFAVQRSRWEIPLDQVRRPPPALAQASRGAPLL